MTGMLKLGLVVALAGVVWVISADLEGHEAQGMEVVMWCQALRSPPMDWLMRIGTAFGFEFFLVLVPVLAWSGRPKYHKIGAHLFILLLLILFSVSFLKAVFSRPRPFAVNSMISDPNSADKIEFSYPSGHAWASTSFFFLAHALQKRRFWVAAIIVSLYTLFSRVYFGVHYPHDLAAGVACGGILLVLFTYAQSHLDDMFGLSEIEHKVESELKEISKYTYKGIRILDRTNVVAVALLLATTIANLLLDKDVKAKQGGLIFVPFCLLGFVLCRPFMPRVRCSSGGQHALRVLLGVPIIFSLYFLYLILGPAGRPLVAAFVGGWMFCVAPYVFLKLHLVSPPHPSPPPQALGTQPSGGAHSKLT